MEIRAEILHKYCARADRRMAEKRARRAEAKAKIKKNAREGKRKKCYMKYKIGV